MQKQHMLKHQDTKMVDDIYQANDLIEIKVNNVGAVLVTSRRADLGGGLRLKQGIRRDADRVPVNPASADAPIGLYVFGHPLHNHFRRPALVLYLPISIREVFQQASLPR
ncbi:hypothetical protein RJ639_036063 [Escallonia herrerae]|uniref:Uncharacterized protein n=1 Tax=Escallonia herrerae TaxID=1293975 RepID=A0AA88X2Z6_9ASTE|nr:hypothetical protein RJ639_036063 [Escallonia herrerae]